MTDDETRGDVIGALQVAAVIVVCVLAACALIGCDSKPPAPVIPDITHERRYNELSDRITALEAPQPTPAEHSVLVLPAEVEARIRKLEAKAHEHAEELPAPPNKPVKPCCECNGTGVIDGGTAPWHKPCKRCGGTGDETAYEVKR